jgi:hypothetical protein
MQKRKLLLAVVLVAAAAPMLHAAIERIDLRVEGMT